MPRAASMESIFFEPESAMPILNSKASAHRPAAERGTWFRGFRTGVAVAVLAIPGLLLVDGPTRQWLAYRSAALWFKFQPAEVVLCGDSNLAQIGLANRITTWGLGRSLSLAEHGATIERIVGQAAQAERLRSRWIVVMAGTNNLHREDASLLQSWSALLRTPRGQGTARWAVVGLPLQLDPARDARIAALNRQLAAAAAAQGWTFVDANASVFLAHEPRSAVLADAVHLNAEGRQRWLVAVRRALDARP